MTTHAIIGLPRSGKTTFLAALWHVLNAAETETRLRLARVTGDVQYLNAIADAWRRCEEVPRTSMAAETVVTIEVDDPSKSRRVTLAFPDLSGESFQVQVGTRTCAPNYPKLFDGDTGGILLFVNADRPSDGLSILDVAGLAGDEPVSTAETAEQPRPKPWKADLLPEQVKLVELLQFLLHPPFQRRKRRIALMVSAWDVLPSPRPSPSAWVSRELPLLGQFLLANRDQFDVRAFGVSAQGGDVRGERRADLLATVPSKRIECVGEGVDLHDITGPVDWLSSEES